MEPKNNQEKKKDIAAFWKKVLFHNLSIKILSFLGALLVWLFIVNIDDPYKTKSYMVHVDLTNEDALRSVHKVYEIVEGGTATVRVRGRRSVVDNLDASDIKATADLSELSAVNSVDIKPSLKIATSSDVELECTQVLKVSLEDMETKQVKVTVETEGTPAEGYTVGSCNAKPNVIEVSGGESVIDRIATVKVTLNVNGASDSFLKNLEPAAYDKKGNKIISSTLSFEKKNIRVKARLLQNKTIPVKIHIKGKVANGYEYVDATCVPEEIEIAGSARKLASISRLDIPIDVTGLTSDSSDLERDSEVVNYLPDGITIPEEYQKISVKIDVEKKKEKKIKIPTSSIMLKNLDAAYEGEAYDPSGNIEIVVSGKESYVKGLEADDITASVDCGALGAGTYQLPVDFSGLKDCEIVEEVYVHVLIKDKSNAEVTATPTPTKKPSAKATKEPSKTKEPAKTEKPTQTPQEDKSE